MESKPAIQRIPPSYVAFDGNPRFVGSTSSVEGGDFKVGDEIAFNIHYKATGPRAVRVVSNTFEAFISARRNI